MRDRIETEFTKLMGCRYPIICAPMFLVSNVDLVVAASEAGAVGAMPSLNWRTPEEFRKAVREVKSRTKNPFAVNLIVNKAMPRQEEDLAICAEERVPLVITSLGNPKDVIARMHGVGSKVFCDVTTLEFGKKVEALGADGVIAVAAGAGGHAGPISPLVLIPHLKRHLKIPIVAAGGVAEGAQLAAVLMLGAAAAQIGTRFIASNEAKVSEGYKKAILDSHPEDIVMTLKISGTPAAVIRTPYTEKIGYDLNPIEKYLHKNPHAKKWIKMARAYLGSKMVEKAAAQTTWKEVWSAGQGVGLIDEILPAAKIVEKLVSEYERAKSALCNQT